MAVFWGVASCVLGSTDRQFRERTASVVRLHGAQCIFILVSKLTLIPTKIQLSTDITHSYLTL
jgi:hypothetical protein